MARSAGGALPTSRNCGQDAAMRTLGEFAVQSRRSPLIVCMALAAMLLSALAGCRPGSTGQAHAASGPAAALERLAQYLGDDDLAGFARAAVPPADYLRLRAAWSEGRSRWPLTELPMDDQLVPLLAALSAPDSERDLIRSFERHLARQDAAVRQAAMLLGPFAAEYVRHRGSYTEAERAHYVQIVAALEAWAARAPLADPKRAPPAIAGLARQARAAGLHDDAGLRKAGLEDSLRRLAPFFAELKSVLADYGLPVQDSLKSLRATLLEQAGDRAMLRVEYPLAGRRIEATVTMIHRDGRWYPEGHLRRAGQALSDGPAPAADDSVTGLGDNAPDA